MKSFAHSRKIKLLLKTQGLILKLSVKTAFICVESAQSCFVAGDEEEHIVSRIEQQFYQPFATAPHSFINKERKSRELLTNPVFD